MLIDLMLRLVTHHDIVLLCLAGAVRTAINSDSLSDDIFRSAAACLVFVALFAAIKVLYRAIRGIEGLGAGDVKLVAAAGFLLTVDDFALSVWIGAILTAGFVAARARGRPARRLSRIRAPYGGFLAAAMFLVWLFRAATDTGPPPGGDRRPTDPGQARVRAPQRPDTSPP